MFFRNLAILTTVFLAQSLSAQNTSLSSLELALSPAKKLDDFLVGREIKSDYKEKLFSYLDQESFGCQRFDHVLSEIKRLSQSVPGFSERIFAKQKDLIHVPVVEMTKPRSLREKGRIKRIPSTPKQTWIFRSAARKLHGVWWDPSKQGCQQNKCAGLAVNAPLRWAAALQDSHLFVLESRGKYQGSAISVIPVLRNGRRFHLVNLMGEAQLTNKRYFHHKGKVIRASLWEIWAKNLEEEFPNLIHVRRDAKGTLSAYLDAIRLGPASDFQPRDPMARMIAQNAPKRCSVSGKMASANSLLFEQGLIEGQGGTGSGAFPTVTTTTTATIDDQPFFQASDFQPENTFLGADVQPTLGAGPASTTPVTKIVEKVVDTVEPYESPSHPNVTEVKLVEPQINIGSNDATPTPIRISATTNNGPRGVPNQGDPQNRIPSSSQTKDDRQQPNLNGSGDRPRVSQGSAADPLNLFSGEEPPKGDVLGSIRHLGDPKDPDPRTDIEPAPSPRRPGRDGRGGRGPRDPDQTYWRNAPDVYAKKYLNNGEPIENLKEKLEYHHSRTPAQAQEKIDEIERQAVELLKNKHECRPDDEEAAGIIDSLKEGRQSDGGKDA